jgi:glycosyltransferase 2 family protein
MHPIFSVKAILSAALLLLIIVNIDWHSLSNTIANFDGFLLTFAVACMIGQILFLSLRWKLLIDHAEQPLAYPDALRITLASQIANMLLLTSVTGIVVRVALTMQYKISLLKASCAMLIDRLMTICAIIFLATLALPFAGKIIQHQTLMQICVYATIIGIIAIVIAPIWLAPFLKNLAERSKRVAGALEYLSTVSADRPSVIKIAITSLFAQGLYFFAVIMIAQSTGVTFSIIDLLVVLPAITLVASLPLSIGGWGVREGAFIIGLGFVGISKETAFLISVEVALLCMLATLLTGLPALFDKKLTGLIRQALKLKSSNAA